MTPVFQAMQEESLMHSLDADHLDLQRELSTCPAS